MPRSGPRGGPRAGSWLVAALALAAGLGAASVVAAATFNVDTMVDDASLTACDDAVPNDCSLRGATIAANSSPGPHTINVPAGRYGLTPASGRELTVTEPLTLVGAGAAATVIEGADPGPGLYYAPVFALRGTITVRISGVTVTGGSTSGISAPSATLTVADSVIVGNGGRFIGGGIYSEGTLTVINSTIRGNATRGPGGGIYASNLTLIGSMVGGNGCGAPGCGIYVSTLTAVNSTVSGNSGHGIYVYARRERGVVVAHGSANLNNVTVTRNLRGLEAEVDNATLTVSNSIVAGNQTESVNPPGADCSGTLTSQGYNLIGDATGCTVTPTTGDQIGTGATPIDPRLAPLGDNGGPTPTHALCTAAGVPDASCTGPSPAIDAGNPAPPGSGTACEGTDQRGVGRPGGLACDTGAFEVAAARVHGPISINAGGPAVATFVADANFSGGTPATNWTGAIDTSAVAHPAPQAVYQSERYGATRYVIPGLTPGASYGVRLHFAENYWSAAGQRIFNIAINGTTVLSNFDVFATAGAAHKATVQEFTAPADSSGEIIIVSTDVVNHALINGLEVFAAPIALALNNTAFHPGDTMVLTVTLTPGSVPAPVDAFLVIRLPDGSMYSLQIGGAVRGVVPVVAAFVPRPFTGVVVRYTLTGREEAGTYSWFGALTEPGTMNLVGMQELVFTIGP